MTLIEIKLIRVLLICSLAGFSTAQYSVSVERPCPMETVTFTCTAPGNSLRWVSSDGTRITILSTSGLNVPNVVSGYTVTLIAFNDTTLTSTLSRTAENGITVSCLDPLPTLTTIGSSMIQLVDPPGPPSTIRHSTLSSSSNEASVSVQWDPPTETGGRDDLTYTVIISPPAQLSATVLTSTSVTVTAQYNVDYTVSVVATNCAGNSTTADYNFMISGCPMLTNPMNGAFGPTISRLPGSTVTFQCDNGLFPEGIMNVICLATGEWDKIPGEIVCRNEFISCVLPAPPLNGTLLNTYQNTNLTEGSVFTLQCDPGFSLVGATTTTCNNSGLWDPDPALLECVSPTATTTLSTGVTVAIGVTTTFVLSTLFLAALLVMYSFTRKKAVYYTRKTALSVVEPTKPVEPVYEEVLPKEEIELHTNQAYGPLGL